MAGGNARIVEENIVDWLFLPKEEFGRKSGDLIAVRVYGNSMAPEIPNGAIVAVDRNSREIRSESIYALRDSDGGCSVKRVEILDPEHVALVPSNRIESKVEFWKLEAGETIEYRVIGKVVWVGLNLLEIEEAAESPPPYGKKTIGLAQDLPHPRKKEKTSLSKYSEEISPAGKRTVTRMISGFFGPSARQRSCFTPFPT